MICGIPYGFSIHLTIARNSLTLFRMAEPCLYDSHMHTPLCKHARGQPEDYAESALRRNLKGIIITCHSPMPNGFSHSVRMDDSQFPDYLDLVERARAAYEGRLDVRLGMESDWFPGMEAWLTELHQRADYDFILGSIHPFLKEYREAFHLEDALAVQKQYFEHLAQSAECGLFDCLSHPDLIKNLFPESWSVDAVMDSMESALDRIRETGVALELNTSGVLKSIPEMNPGPAMLSAMAQRNIPVVLGSDSHDPYRVGEGFVEGLDLLEEAGYESVSVFQKRQRKDISIEQVRQSLLAVDARST